MSKTKSRAGGRGGKRTGAGRKTRVPSGKGRKITFTLSPSAERLIRTQYPEGEWTLQDAVRGMLWRGIASLPEEEKPRGDLTTDKF